MLLSILWHEQYVTDGLRVKLAEIQAAIRTTEHRLKGLASDKATVTRALRLFEAEDAPSPVSLGFPSGAFSRTILDTIREADRPVCARDIAERLAAKTGRTMEQPKRSQLLARVRNAMSRLSDKLDGELRDRTTYWRVRPADQNR